MKRLLTALLLTFAMRSYAQAPGSSAPDPFYRCYLYRPTPALTPFEAAMLKQVRLDHIESPNVILNQHNTVRCITRAEYDYLAPWPQIWQHLQAR